MSILSDLDLRDLPLGEILDDGVRAVAEDVNRCNADVRAVWADVQRHADAGDAEEFERRLDALEAPAQKRAEAAARFEAAQAMRGFIPMSTATDTDFLRFVRTGQGETRAMGVGTGAGGGYLVPDGFRDKLVERIVSFGGVRKVADIETTDTGADLPWPTIDDSGNAGAILSENTAATEQDATIGTDQLSAYTYTSKLVRVSNQLLEDSGVDLENRLGRLLGVRIARAQNPHFTTGTGTAQPEGIVTGATVGVTAATGGTTTVTYDNLVDLQTSVDDGYIEEGEPGVGWMMNGTTLGAIRKLKDADSRPLVVSDVQAGRPRQLLGYPIFINPAMPSLGVSAKPILFGNFKEGYVIRDVRQVRLMRLGERYAEFNQTAFIAFFRSDGQVQDAYAYRAFQNAAS